MSVSKIRLFTLIFFILAAYIFTLPSGPAWAEEEGPAIFSALTPKASTFGGSAAMRIPIAVPPGRAGLSPNIALTYNSSGSIRLSWTLP